MKLNNFLKEMAQIERIGNKSVIKASNSSAKFDKILEDRLMSAIDKAFESSEELQAMFSMNKFPPYDIEVSKEGPNVKIITNPENGQKTKTALFPLMNIQKYLSNPKGLASFLMMGYKK